MRALSFASGLSGLLSAALLLSGCKSEGDAKPAEKPADPVAAGDSGEPDVAPTPEVVTPPTDVAAGAASVDALLNLVPKGSAGFVILKDPAALLSLVHPFVHSALGTLPKFATDPDDRATLTNAAKKYKELRAALLGADVHLDKGMVAFETGGSPAFIYAAAEVTTLPTIVADLVDEPAKDGSNCTPLTAAPGYFFCSETEAAASAYAPGNEAEQLRKDVATRLPGVDLTNANMVAFVESAGIPLVVETPPGTLQIIFGTPDLPTQAMGFASGGTAPALGMLGAGAAFAWGHVDVAPLKAVLPPDPPFLRPTVEAMTGELLVANLQVSRGLALLAGVKDQAPITGLLALGALQLDTVPPTLTDGSKLEVEAKSIELAGKPSQVVHGRVTPTPESAPMYSAMNLEPEGWAYGAGAYAGLLLGVDEKGLTKLAAATPTGPSAELLATVPPSLGTALTAKRVALAVHAPFDGLGPALTKGLAGVSADQLPFAQGSSDFDVVQAMKSLGTSLAPLSALSQWIELHDERVVGYLSLRVFGDARSDAGRAELAAIDHLLAGKDAAATYAALAGAHGESPRGHTYKVRAGTQSDGTLVSVALLGVMAAIAVPAFTKYLERSKAAAAANP